LCALAVPPTLSRLHIQLPLPLPKLETKQISIQTAKMSLMLPPRLKGPFQCQRKQGGLTPPQQTSTDCYLFLCDSPPNLFISLFMCVLSRNWHQAGQSTATSPLLFPFPPPAPKWSYPFSRSLPTFRNICSVLTQL